MPLVLEPLLADFPLQEQGFKINSVESLGPGGMEIIFALLAKPIAVYMQIALIKV